MTETTLADRGMPLQYQNGSDAHRGRVARVAAAMFDGSIVFLAISVLAAVPYACATNVREAPVNGGGGSSYMDSAPCNLAWATANPRLARMVAELPAGALLLIALPGALAYLVTSGAIPYLLAGGLAVRASWPRQSLRRRTILVVPLAALLLSLPWLSGCFLVVFD